jgi:nucleoside-triphosphatase THEP1
MNSNGKKSSVVDIPLPAGEKDLLGVNTYTEALIRFIADSDTPMTIAIQGEWGSGKTSMMNQLQQELCNDGNASYYGIWVNTWQYALLSDEEIILSRIVNAITEKTMKAINERHPNKYNDNFNKVRDIGKKIFKGMLKVGASQVAGSVGSSVVDEVVGGGELSLTVNDLRENLKDLIEKSIAEDSERRGFVFFIDDLDRIEPTFAVQILELCKNIFDIPECIFVLAIDYDVVVKGLEPKFGKLTDENEREFRSFFDKIIQLPFAMPVSRYGIDDFIVKVLQDVDYLTEKEEGDKHFKETVSAMAKYSVGRNPRALKRLTNSLSLIKIFNQLDESTVQKNDEMYEKLMNIGLICCQIAYPFVYRLLCMEPDYQNWDEATAARLKLKQLTEEELNVLDNTEEFDEDWEKVLFRACQRDPYLSNSTFKISDLLNEIAKQLPEEKDLGETINSLLALSSVTNVEASDQVRGGEGKYQRTLYEDIDGYTQHLESNGVESDYIELLEYIHEDIREMFANEDDVKFLYSPTGGVTLYAQGKVRGTKFAALSYSKSGMPHVEIMLLKDFRNGFKKPRIDDLEITNVRSYTSKNEKKKLPFIEYYLIKLKEKSQCSDEIKDLIKKSFEIRQKGLKILKKGMHAVKMSIAEDNSAASSETMTPQSPGELPVVGPR